MATDLRSYTVEVVETRVSQIEVHGCRTATEARQRIMRGVWPTGLQRRTVRRVSRSYAERVVSESELRAMHGDR